MLHVRQDLDIIQKKIMFLKIKKQRLIISTALRLCTYEGSLV
jgi:hypothetical protein